MTATLPGDEAFQIANVIKYVSRYRAKEGGKKAIEDLRKARNYLDMLIEHILKKAPTVAEAAPLLDARPAVFDETTGRWR